MKPRFIPFITTVTAALLLVAFRFLPAQEEFSKEKSWADGPKFSDTRSDTNVLVSQYVTLKPRFGVSGRDDSLNLALYGLDWRWPRTKLEISSAEDIDYRIVSGQTLYLITDALGRRIFEFKPSTEEEVWSFGSENVSDPSYLDRPVDSDIFTDAGLFKLVITDMGRNRIIKVDKETKNVEWQYGDPDGRAGEGPNQLNLPADAVHIPGTSLYIIADKGNRRVIMVSEPDNSVLWTYENDSLSAPVDVEYLPGPDQILITDQGSHRVMLVDVKSKNVVWQYGTLDDPGDGVNQLNAPTDADYLSNGDILIADAGNNRIIEVNQAGDIVWHFRRPLNALRDVDQLPDKKLLVINEMYPSRLGYSDSLIVSKVYDLGENREANFDSIAWNAEVTPGVTGVQLQLRSANSLSELETAGWYGPGGENTFYVTPGQIVEGYHEGDRFYQFRALLTTTDPLSTPVLNNVILTYHYYDIGVTGVFWSPVIKESGDSLVAKWKDLTFTTILPSDAAKRDNIQMELRINDARSYKALATFPASITSTENVFNLESIASLIGVQEIQLVGYMSTSNASISPVLKSWKITWEAVPTTSATLKFVNTKGAKVDYYRATTILPSQESFVDSVIVLLTDQNLEFFKEKVKLTVESRRSGDIEEVELVSQGLGIFRETPPMPLLISDSPSPYNQIFECLDRDTLVVTYQDETKPENRATARILVVKNTEGELTVIDAAGEPITEAKFGTELYVRVRNEQDHNIDPNVQETITVTMYDRTTIDEEKVTLYEVPDDSGRYNTGEFISQVGITVVDNNNGVKNDGQLQTVAGHKISIEYDDNIPLIEIVSVPEQEGGGGVFIFNLGGAPYIVEVAPNPYYENKSNAFKLRVASATGSLIVRRIEIFNLAGEKVREIDGNTLRFSTGLPVPNEKYGVAENWWDLMSDSGHKVSSGTYWVKVHADIIHQDTGDLERVAFFKKFVVVR